MIVYGTKIVCDIDLPLALSDDIATRYSIELSSKLPERLKTAVTCGSPLYWAHGRDVYLYSDRAFNGSAPKQPWCYEVKDIVRFYWVGGESKIYYKIEEQGDDNLLGFWLVHLFLPLYFTLENMYDFLHAGAVEVDGKPILFIAPSMGGKSTMTDYFIQRGHALISDDKVPVFIDNGTFMVAGSHPYHRPYRKFEELGYRVDNFIGDFKPIHAFYQLERAEADATVLIDEIKGYKKFDALLPNYLYMFTYLKPKRLKYLSTMLNSIKVFRVRVPWDMERLPEVYEKVCKHSML